MPKHSIIGGLSPEELEKIQEILGHCEKLERAQLFGSRAINTHKATSDIDLALFGENLSHQDLNNLKIAFEDSTLPHTFDLIPHHTIKEPKLLAHIQRRGVDIYRRGFYLGEDGEWIPEGWDNGTLGNNATVQTGFAFKSIHMGNEGVPLVKITEIQPPYVNMSGATRVAVEPYETKDLSKHEIRKGDSLVAMTGATIGKVGKYLGDETAWLNQRVAKIAGNVSTTDNFIHYVLKSNRFAHHVTNTSSGSSAQQNISGGELQAYGFPLPPLPEQKAIAAVLSSLDDKIELLREQNATLEALAQTLFKRWFIDFNFPTSPSGKPYKDSGGKMVPSELGEIPEGWRVGKLEDFYDITIGKTPPRKETEWFSLNANDIPWFSIKDLGDCGMYAQTSSEFLTNEAVETFNVQRVAKGTVLLSFKLTVGRVCIAGIDCCTNEAIAHFWSDSSSKLVYVYLFLKNFDHNSWGSTSSIATATNSKVIKSQISWMPKDALLHAFSCAVLPVVKKIENNAHQIQTLTKLRNTFLPKLMKGEIRIIE